MIMKQIRALLILLALAVPISSTSCLTPQETLSPEDRRVANVERALLITQIAVDKAHVLLWSDPLRAKLSECKGSADMPSCMGHFNPENNRKIVDALKVYKEASEAAGEAILLSQGDTSLKALVAECADAALSILGVIPGAEKYTVPVQRVVESLR